MEATSESHMIFITDHLINMVRHDLVYNGELDDRLLSQIEANWKRKMIQAGLISSVHDSIPTHTLDLNIFPRKDESGIEIGTANLAIPKKSEHDGFYIPQQDGTIGGDFGINMEPLVELNTYAPNDENEEILNENDDDEEDAIGDEDKYIPDLVICQFNQVKRTKNKWDCKFKAGVIKINDKNFLFSEARGKFNF